MKNNGLFSIFNVQFMFAGAKVWLFLQEGNTHF